MLKKLVRPVISAAIAVAAGMLVPGGPGAGLLDVAGLRAIESLGTALFAAAPTTVELAAVGPLTELASAYRLRVTELPEPLMPFGLAINETPIMAPTGCPFEVRAIIASDSDAFAIVADAQIGVGVDESSRETRLVRTGDIIATARGRATITVITKSAVELKLNAAAIRCEFNTR